MCLAQGHNAVTWVRLEPAALRSRVKLSTTVPSKVLLYIHATVADPEGALGASAPPGEPNVK